MANPRVSDYPGNKGKRPSKPEEEVYILPPQENGSSSGGPPVVVEVTTANKQAILAMAANGGQPVPGKGKFSPSWNPQKDESMQALLRARMDDLNITLDSVLLTVDEARQATLPGTQHPDTRNRLAAARTLLEVGGAIGPGSRVSEQEDSSKAPGHYTHVELNKTGVDLLAHVLRRARAIQGGVPLEEVPLPQINVNVVNLSIAPAANQGEGGTNAIPVAPIDPMIVNAPETDDEGETRGDAFTREEGFGEGAFRERAV